jgi:hypothetical protein
MSGFFNTLKKSFKDVKVDGTSIDTSDFLEASESLTGLFGTIYFTFAA